MKTNRRDFLKQSGLAGISGIASGQIQNNLPENEINMNTTPTEEVSIIGQYGAWAVKKNLDNKIPSISFRNKKYTSLTTWKKIAHQKLVDRLGIPDIGTDPKVTVLKSHDYDGLLIEEVEWQLPYGRPTKGILLKPNNATKPLPGILAFHDHGGNKYFGTRKITKTSDPQHPMMIDHQRDYYEGKAWANEIAERGYVVLVSDAFPFASRRVYMQDVPAHMREGLNDTNPEEQSNIDKYNKWAGQHEHVMSKSLISAGTTWPAVFYAEDKIALDILYNRPDVIKSKIGCCGLSGGGMRTVFMAGLDSRITCAIPVGFMTTWKDFVLHKSFTHTWMTYVPILPNELDFPEILGLRVPAATLVLNDSDDQLYTLPEMQQADEILKEVYKKAGASSKYKCSFYPGPHKFDQAMQAEAFDWFDKWLKV